MLNFNFNFFQKIKNIIFPFYKNKELRFIFNILQEGFSKDIVVARFVGGCVRKHLSGDKIDDIDVATIHTPEKIKERFSKTNLKVIETGAQHGTITIVSKKHKVEITTLRKDIKTDGRHAEVEYTDDWRLDSERRDFTINAIYVDINGNIFDPQMGSVDLKNNNVKFIGDPQKRIEEDYLRIIRFIRFKIMYDLNIESTTIAAIKQNLDGIKKISKERILMELLKILDLENFIEINKSSHLKEIFQMIFPEFIYLDRLSRLKKVGDRSKLNRDIILATLLIDEKANHEYFAHKYNISNKIKKTLDKLAFNLDKVEKNRDYLDKDLIKNIYINGKDQLILLNLLNYAKNSKIKLNEFEKTLNGILKSNIPKFHIDGEYLKQNGMQEGASLGKVLKIVEDEWVNNKFKISDDRVKQLIQNNSY